MVKVNNNICIKHGDNILERTSKHVFHIKILNKIVAYHTTILLPAIFYSDHFSFVVVKKIDRNILTNKILLIKNQTNTF